MVITHHHHHHHHHDDDGDGEEHGDKGEVTIGGKKVGDDRSMEKYIEYIPGTEINMGPV